MKTIMLFTGGARSGKSTRALEYAMTYDKRAFIATARAFDDEMRERIARHKEERSGFITIEEPLDLAAAIRSLDRGIDVAIVDCLTVWLGNLMHERAQNCQADIDAFLEVLKAPPCNLVLVTNEVGMGIVPVNDLARKFRDTIGELNRKVAAMAQKVVLMVCGMEVVVKGRKME